MKRNKENRAVEELRKLGRWPFPKWENGRIVVVRVSRKRVLEDALKHCEDAPF